MKERDEEQSLYSSVVLFSWRVSQWLKVERILHGTIVDNKTNTEKFASVIRQSVRTNTEWNNKLNK
jgi:hypothetical protein